MVSKTQQLRALYHEILNQSEEVNVHDSKEEILDKLGKIASVAILLNLEDLIFEALQTIEEPVNE
jgi:hypothetical protein